MRFLIKLTKGDRLRRRRERLLVIQNGLCYYCERTMDARYGRAPVLEHFTPRHMKGRHTVLACAWCDQNKGAMDGSLYLSLLKRVTRDGSLGDPKIQGALKREAKEINCAIQISLRHRREQQRATT